MSGPFEQHLREAIVLNRERAPLYATVSRGASRRISTALIGAEYLLLPVARWFDRRAAPYQQAGVPILETLFEPMSAAPPFQAHQPWRPAIEPIVAVSPRAIGRRVTRAFRENDFRTAASVMAGELAALTTQPQTDCLVRHLLESSHRIAVLAPAQIAAAEGRGLPSPAPLLARLLRLHLWGLGPAGVLDRWARPLQMRGIPILARDVPPIPLRSE